MVTLDAEALRPHLLRWFAVESDRAAAAAGLRLDVQRAQEHHRRAVAVAMLLTRIGWAPDGAAAVTIDALQHGWAAREALRALVRAEELVIEREVAAGEHEAAGEAMGRRRDARVTITEIEEEHERIGAAIEPHALPSPSAGSSPK